MTLQEQPPQLGPRSAIDAPPRFRTRTLPMCKWQVAQQSVARRVRRRISHLGGVGSVEIAAGRQAVLERRTRARNRLLAKCARSRFPHGDIEVFMNVAATPAQVANVATAIAKRPDIARSRHLDHGDAYREFSAMFKDQPNLTSSMSPADLPESFRVQLRAGADARTVSGRLRSLDGVSSIERSSCPS